MRDGIRITLGFNAQVNVSLNVATLQETVTVSGESPVIDTVGDAHPDQLRPADAGVAAQRARHVVAAGDHAVGDAESRGRRRQHRGHADTYFAYGYSGQNRPLIEGINTTEGTAAAGFYLDYGSFEEVFIGAAGNSAEMPNPGVLTQFVGKSGGNRPSVSLYYDYENERHPGQEPRPRDQVMPATGARSARTATASPSYKNLNLGVGGPIVKDRMWGHFAYLNQQNSVAAPPAGSFLDGTPFNTKLFNYTGKATYQLNQANKFIGYLQHGTKQQPNRTDSSNRLGAPVHITGDSTVLQDSPSWVYKGEWNGTIGQNMFAEFRAGQFGYNFGLDSNTDAHALRGSLSTNEIARRRTRLAEQAPPQSVHRRAQLLQGQLRRRLAQLQDRRRVPGRVGQHHLGRRATPTTSSTSLAADGAARRLGAAVQQRHQLAERAGHHEHRS